jgi:acyl-CoA thioester hydrolase
MRPVKNPGLEDAEVRFPLEARYNDYDTKGHVNNAVYLTYFEIARARAWLEIVGGDPDVPFIVAEARVRYLQPAMLGTPLEVSVETSEVRTRSWTWRYQVLDARDGSVVAEGETAQVMFDYAARKAVPVPDELRVRLLRIGGNGGAPRAAEGT